MSNTLDIIIEAVISEIPEINFGRVVNSADISDEIFKLAIQNGYRFNPKDSSSLTFDDLHDSISRIVAESSKVDYNKIWNADSVAKKVSAFINENFEITNKGA